MIKKKKCKKKKQIQANKERNSHGSFRGRKKYKLIQSYPWLKYIHHFKAKLNI